MRCNGYNVMGTHLQRLRNLVGGARLAQLNARRLVIQAQYLTQKARDIHRVARRTCGEARRRR